MSEASTEKRTEEETSRPGPGPQSPEASEPVLEFFQKWIHHLKPTPEPTPATPPAHPPRFSLVLFFLKVLPYAVGGMFFGSLYWDTSGQILLPWRSEPVSTAGMLRMIAVSGLIGYGTNWLAIKMLFYPRKRRPLLGQGLIPSRKDRIVMRLADSISQEIINSELILKQIRESGLVSRHRDRILGSLRDLTSRPEFRADILAMTEHYVTGFLRSPEVQERLHEFVGAVDFEKAGGLEGGVLRFFRFLQGDKDIAQRLKELMAGVTFRAEKFEDQLSHYLDRLPDTIEEKSGIIEEYALGAMVFLVEQINVRNVVYDNLEKFDEIRLERLLLRSTSDQLQYIIYLGTFLGILGGFFIWLPFESGAVLGGTAGIVVAIDYLLMRAKEKKTAASSKPRT